MAIKGGLWVGFVGTASVLAIGEWTESHWIIGAISYHKIYGLYSVGHRKVDISGDVTKVGRTDEQTTRKDRATQLLSFRETLSFAITFYSSYLE